ncbi:hypothetical protein [Burkholderia ambifaria]|jgi:hypothetical protein|uniref:hypothetical protein n=1 Tax=Burkholderia TaxID=32008 RepID=UPI00158BD0C6|nr:hypothetical protein [Burkholderia ambifaria]MDP9585519.1 hypothetical protein [Burkholderia contaminans]QQK00228.1 hypothetical protein JG536_18200 [Burkholderia ambifaria]
MKISKLGGNAKKHVRIAGHPGNATMREIRRNDICNVLKLTGRLSAEIMVCHVNKNQDIEFNRELEILEINASHWEVKEQSRFTRR